MYSDTVEFVRHCVNCQQAKVGHTIKPEKGRTYVPYLPMETLAIDILAVGRPGSQGNKYILTVMDYVTRFGWALEVKSRTATEIAAVLVKHIFLIFGAPSYLVSDRVSEFKGILKQLQIR